ncbi:MAG: hypothetical protein JNJ61_05400 [Anaerolineae bacterium]|nr:hypothetical protein [Anaerolineae bacterium]
MTATSQTPYGFTGELTDSNGLVYLRARYYSPALGVFASQDPFEGIRSSHYLRSRVICVNASGR